MWRRLTSQQLQRISALPTETEFNQTCTQRSLNESSLCVEGQGRTCHFSWHFSNFNQNCFSSLSIVWFLLNPAHSNHLMDLHHSWAQGEGHVSKFTRVREETLHLSRHTQTYRCYYVPAQALQHLWSSWRQKVWVLDRCCARWINIVRWHVAQYCQCCVFHV